MVKAHVPSQVFQGFSRSADAGYIMLAMQWLLGPQTPMSNDSWHTSDASTALQHAANTNSCLQLSTLSIDNMNTA